MQIKVSEVPLRDEPNNILRSIGMSEIEFLNLFYQICTS